MIINQDKYACRFCEGIVCAPGGKKGRLPIRDCDKCGHNPEVAQARLQEYCRTHNISIPEEKQAQNS